MKKPVLARIQFPTAEVVVEIPAIYGDAAGVAARMRASGLQAKKKGDEVLVNGSADWPPAQKSPK